MAEPFTTLSARTLVLAEANLDTDQIVPARYLATTARDGLGEGCFADLRAKDPNHPMNAPDASERRILVAGENFGCGSSREHAAWALYDFGFRAVLSSKLADIFRANALKNGLLAVEIEADLHGELMNAAGARVHLDLNDRTVTVEDGAPRPFTIDPFARRCLLEGVDQLAFLVGREDAIQAFEARRAAAAS